MLWAVWSALLAISMTTPSLRAAEPAVLKAHTRWSVDQAHPGETLYLTVVLLIADDLHINANADQIAPHPAFSPYPTQLQVVEQSPAVVVGKPQFPPAHTIAVGFSSQPLAVFDGQVEVVVPVEVLSDAAADILTIGLALRYQGCDATSCYMPETVALTAQLPMAAAPRP
jgi:hypothetical protein